ncbi:MAG: hypothetical protein GYA21_07625 [Myxococcales bacterium]|nr:hypothetical protein [Myxococcales bacterium]
MKKGDGTEKEGKPDATLVALVGVEQAGVTAISTIAGAGMGPLAGIAGGALVKILFRGGEALIHQRGSERIARFYDELIRAASTGRHSVVERLVESEPPEIREVLYQAFRRVLDSASPSVIAALASLTLEYAERSPDSFFRGLGGLLQDLSEEEFRSFQVIISAVAQMEMPVVTLMPWNGPKGHEVKLTATRGNQGPIFAIAEPPGVRRILKLMEQEGLTWTRESSGQDIATTGHTDVEQAVAKRIRGIVGQVAVQVHASNLDRLRGE